MEVVIIYMYIFFKKNYESVYVKMNLLFRLNIQIFHYYREENLPKLVSVSKYY